MMTAVDTNVVLDVLAGDAASATVAFNALAKAAEQGSVILSTICYAELAGNFASAGEFAKFLAALGLSLVDLDQPTAFLAGRFYKEYRLRGGTRARILPDFIVAAHAQIHADRLLTRDSRFFGESFPSLKAIAPDAL